MRTLAQWLETVQAKRRTKRKQTARRLSARAASILLVRPLDGLINNKPDGSARSRSLKDCTSVYERIKPLVAIQPATAFCASGNFDNLSLPKRPCLFRDLRDYE